MCTRIAVVSDIHGNSWALQSVLEDLKRRGITMIYNLGDSLYGPLDPSGTFQLLQQDNIMSISGNEDRLIVESYYSTEKNDPTLDYVVSELGTKEILWLTSLKKILILNDFFLCHGTPSNDDVYLFEKVSSDGMRLKSQKEIQNDICMISQKVICCGHSHMKHCLHLPSGQYLINPGSVGLPAYADMIPFPHKMESGNPHASYSIIVHENNHYSIDHISLLYNWEDAAQCAEKNNRRDWAKWLRSGTV
jgi:predicted phosphodiesterase